MNHDSDGMDEAGEQVSRLGIAVSISMIEALTRRLEEIARRVREDRLRDQVEAELGLHRAAVRETVDDLREVTTGTNLVAREPGDLVQTGVPGELDVIRGTELDTATGHDVDLRELTHEEVRERVVWAAQFDPERFEQMRDAYQHGDGDRFSAVFEEVRRGWDQAPESERQWVRDAIAWERAQFEAEEQRHRGGEELGASQRLGIEAAEAHRAGNEGQAREAGAKSDRLYDSADRRLAVAAELEASGADVEVIEARTLSDTAQARPAREAVTATATKRTRPRGQLMTAERTAELGR